MDISRITLLRKQQGKTATYLCALIGQGKGYLTDIKNKNLNIPEEYLQIIANDLGTTSDYLRGVTDDPSIREMLTLNEDEMDLIKIYRSIKSNQLRHEYMAMAYNFGERAKNNDAENESIDVG